MKKIIFLAAVVSSFAACNRNTANKAETTEKQTAAVADGTGYTVDSSSTITWTGSKPTGKHTGTFKIKDGSLNVKDGALTSGTFTIDINSLNNEDLAGDAESKGKLEGHLKSPDFFDVAKYPTAKFEITAVEPNTDSTKKDITHIIKGNLTLKDSTKNVAIPARVTIDAKTVSASADFSIDRTLWGMNYKGPDNPQDWIITKTVALKLNINASVK
ncbi:MAG: YceI family protein [Ferruginibacter sp.]|nr:YceI family protein [Ferruginibacter sp.]